MIAVRNYLPSDYPQVQSILQSSDMYDEVWDSEANLSSIIKANPQAIQVAEENGHIVGVILIDSHGEKVKFFYRLAVLQEFRGQGAGSALLKKAEQIAQKMGAQEIAVFVDTENTIVQRFYTMKGYQTSGKKFICMYKPVDKVLA